MFYAGRQVVDEPIQKEETGGWIGCGGRLFFYACGAVAGVGVAQGDVRIDGCGFHLVIILDRFREAVYCASSRECAANGVADKRVTNNPNCVPVQGVNYIVAGETDQVAAVGGAEQRDNKVGASRDAPNTEG